MRFRSILALAFVCTFSFSGLHAQQTAKITSSGIGYLEYVPQDYSKNTNDYPIVIFLHGIGEKGTTSTDPTTLKSSVQAVAKNALPRYIKDGAQYPFIVISPQLKSSYSKWPANYVMDVLNHVKKYLRVDERRIYITGLSLGGYGTWTTLGEYPDVFAAAVVVCSGGNVLSKACDIASRNVPIWGFHGTSDNVVSYTVTTKMINAINGCTPKPNPLAKTTLFSGMGHNVWDKTYKETDALKWLTSFTKASSTGGATNSIPTVSAGADKSITLPVNEVYLQGSASDVDGSIASYAWTKLSGEAASLGGAATSTLRASGLVAGSYSFRLTVKDDKGATKYDDVQVTVLEPVTSNVPPTTSPGSDQLKNLKTISLSGLAAAKYGQIEKYNWINYSGASALLLNGNTGTVTVNSREDDATVSGARAATTTGDGGASASANIAPSANAGSDLTTTSSSVTLSGNGNDEDGNIVSYNWTQYGGPPATVSNANTTQVTISGLAEGTYYFQLMVTDNSGATDSDSVMLTVLKSSSASANVNQ